jgi:HKD family nuclease
MESLVNADFIVQPSGIFRVGDFLIQGLADPRWTEFRAAIAFVKRSGTKHIRDALEAFSERGAEVRIAAGIDAGGTSAEGLSDLMSAVAGRGTIFVFNNAGSSTFHPKVYCFKNDAAAEVVIGSGNLTEGGLFTNYEASLLLRLDRTNEDDAALLDSISTALNTWSTPTPGLCYALNAALLARLVADGLVPDEARAWGDEKIGREAARVAEHSLFARHAVPAAPRAPRPPAAETDDAEESGEQEDDEGLVVTMPPPVEAQGGTYKVFLMTLQRTDVGVGQTTEGTSRRSPEIFIPLVARNYDPEFWGWPDLFTEDATWDGPVDRDGMGKMDRSGVMVRLGGTTFPVHFWYNPDKKDLRLRSEHMRSAGSIGDILYVERSNGASGFAYYVDVVPQGSPRHAELLAKCTNTVRNSKKVFGYL